MGGLLALLPFHGLLPSSSVLRVVGEGTAGLWAANDVFPTTNRDHGRGTGCWLCPTPQHPAVLGPPCHLHIHLAAESWYFLYVSCHINMKPLFGEEQINNPE